MSKLQAMVIEHDYDAAMITAEALKAADYEVTVIMDGENAQQELLTQTPYLVTLDLHLPGVTGETLLEQIRSDERLAKTYVMLISADDRLAQIIGGQCDNGIVKAG